MTISTGSFILLLCSIITGLVVESIKKMKGDVKSPNILAAIVSVVVGIGISVGYILLKKIPFCTDTILYIVGIVGLSWLTAMLGYDKVVQAIMQVKR